MTISKAQFEARSKGGKIGGKAKVKKGFAMLSKEELKKIASKGGKAGRHENK